jgi:hypothetical protein
MELDDEPIKHQSALMIEAVAQYKVTNLVKTFAAFSLRFADVLRWILKELDQQNPSLIDGKTFSIIGKNQGVSHNNVYSLNI